MADDQKPAADQAARLAALDTEQSFIVQAPAGSGKTGLLTQRFLALLSRAAEPEEILAITFTHKAAGEMRSRILGSLQRGTDATPPVAAHERRTWELARKALQQDEEQGWQLLLNPGRLRIQTIDALCASLTRQMPLLSAFGAQPSIADDAAYLYIEAARKALADIESGESWSPSVERLLRHLDNNLQRVEDLLASMLARRDHWLRHLADRDARHIQRHELESVLCRIIEEHLAVLAELAPAELGPELAALAVYAASNLERDGVESAVRDCAHLTSWPGDSLVELPQWHGLATLLLTGEGAWRKQVTKTQGFPPAVKTKQAIDNGNGEFKSRITALLDRLRDAEEFRQQLADLSSLPAPTFSEAQWQILQAMIELLPIAVAHLELVFRARGSVDFSEISQRAVLALGADEQPTDLALAMDYRIRHILVDEFQDTSLSQFQLLERLTAGWMGEAGRTLFLVGDPMQSIYRFREAEVALYLRARRHGIGSVRLVPLNLSVNFRSRDNVVAWFNKAFDRIFPRHEDLTTGAVTYAFSEPLHIGDGNSTVELYPAFSDTPEQEAGQVVSIIQHQRQQDPQQTIAILVRARSHLTSIVGALSRAGLSYRALEIEHLGKRQPVLDLVMLTRALLHLADRVAWIAVLRAPWCGLTLADIERLIGDERNRTVWDLMQDHSRLTRLSDDARQRVAAIAGVVDGVLRRRQRLPIHQWIYGCWLALGGPATLPAARDIDDCERFFQLLQKMEADAVAITAGSLQAQLEKLYAGTDTQADERLQVMTIHKAKGLEFDTVILPGLGRKPPSRSRQLLTWAERARDDGRSDLILAPIAASGEDNDAVSTYLHYLDRKREQNESVRLLYVAATRAKRSLHLLGHTSVKEDKDVRELQSPTAGSLLATLWPAVAEEFEQQFRQHAEATTVAGETSTANGIYSAVAGIERLQRDWMLPPGFSVASGETVTSETPVEYSWVGPGARHVGTIVHRLLEHIVQHGTGSWQKGRSEVLVANVRKELTRLGVPLADIDASITLALQAVDKALADERGRWLLSNEHQDSRCEYTLISYDKDKGWITSVIDRTFVDDKGVRWIIDYKTSTHSGGGLEAFLSRERERYQGQLDRYAEIMLSIEQRPVRLGLYFPLLGGWREWEYGGAQS